MIEKADFSKRLSQLRMKKGVSARDMSLSIGQSPNYINGIENGDNFPSMGTFFYICDYFSVSPKDFFDFESQNPSKTTELLEIIKSFPDEHIELFLSIAKAIKK